MLVVIHALCAVTACAIAALMLLSWHRSRSPMQLHVGACFVLLGFVNAIVIFDRLHGPANEYATLRLTISVLAIGVLLYGILIKER